MINREKESKAMKEFHLSWLTKENGTYRGHWTHITARTRKEAEAKARETLRDVELVRNGAGTYFALEGLSNCMGCKP